MVMASLLTWVIGAAVMVALSGHVTNRGKRCPGIGSVASARVGQR
jgi:hypothetical protein